MTKKQENCEHDFGIDDNLENGQKLLVTVCGDSFLLLLTCSKCDLKVNKIFNNKHAEYENIEK